MGFWKRRRRERDLDEEIQAHLKMAVRDRIAEGEPPHEAKASVHREFGNVGLVQQITRDMWGWASLQRLWGDICHGFRLMLRDPGFHIVVVGALALGIGANTAVFGIVDAVLIRPLLYRDADRLVTIWEDASHLGVPRNTPAPAEWVDFRAQTTLFEDVAASRGAIFNIIGDTVPEQVFGRRVTANFWSVLGVHPVAGRVFTMEEEQANARLAVISYPLWQRRFGGDYSAIGRELMLNDTPYRIAGVMPRGFSFLPTRLIDVWVPMSFTPEEAANRNLHALNCVARLKDGVTAAQAQAELSAVAGRLSQHHTHMRSAVVVPVREQLAGNTRTALLVLLSGAAIVLLIACANLANMLLARGAQRQREIAIRAALGAGRWRLIRQMITESLLLSVIGGCTGLGLALLLLPLLESLAPETMVVSLAPDLRLFAFTLAASMLSAMLFGSIHAVAGTRLRMAVTLKEGGRGLTGARGRWIRDSLIVAQTCLAMVLLVAAGLIVKTLYRLHSADLGLRSESLLTMMTVPSRYPDHVRRENYLNAILERVRVLPGVVSAGYTSALPLTDPGNSSSYILEGQARDPNDMQDALFRVVTTDYFQTIGARLREGRFFTAADGPNGLPVAIINETFANRHFRGASALGRRLQMGRLGPEFPWYTVIGVVKEIRERGISISLKPAVYLDHPQAVHAWPVPSTLAIRSAGDPAALAAAARAAIWSIDKDQPIARVQTMEAVVSEHLAVPRKSSALLSAFSALALLLSGLGIYGVLSHNVARRTSEIGVRMALGATPGGIVRMVVSRGFVLTAAGLALGLAASVPLTRLITALLYEVPPIDGTTLLASAGVLLGVAALSSALPARRAAQLDPVAALRNE